MIKNLPAVQETPVQSLGQEDPWEKGVETHSVFLPGEFHGQRKLVGYSPWVSKSRIQLSDKHFHFLKSYTKDCHKNGYGRIEAG